MAEYVTRQQVTAEIPPPVLNDALDDNDDGAEDPGLFDNIVSTQSGIVDGFLAGLFTVPFAAPPAKVIAATLVFVLENIYDRTPAQTQNPWRKQADWWREHLQKVGNRELPLDAKIPKSYVPGVVTEECSALRGSAL